MQRNINENRHLLWIDRGKACLEILGWNCPKSNHRDICISPHAQNPKPYGDEDNESNEGQDAERSTSAPSRPAARDTAERNPRCYCASGLNSPCGGGGVKNSDESDDGDAAAADGLEGPSPSASLKCGRRPWPGRHPVKSQASLSNFAVSGPLVLDSIWPRLWLHL